MEELVTTRKVRVALIRFEDAAMRSKVREITARGAILSVADPLAVPDQFELFLPALKLVLACYVVWRDTRRLGVTFKSY